MLCQINCKYFFFSAVYLTGWIVVFLNMPRNYKKKRNKANMPFSTYQEAAKRVIEHAELLQKGAADFDVSKGLCIKISLLKLLFIKVCWFIE